MFLPGVVEYLSTGGVETNHKDFKELRYNESLTNFSCSGKFGTSPGRITHGFRLKSAYEQGLMPYTNYTFDFKVSSPRGVSGGSVPGAGVTAQQGGRLPWCAADPGSIPSIPQSPRALPGLE